MPYEPTYYINDNACSLNGFQHDPPHRLLPKDFLLL